MSIKKISRSIQFQSLVIKFFDFLEKFMYFKNNYNDFLKTQN